MNDESLHRANALLAAMAAQVAVGEVWSGAPADLGRTAGIGDALAVARAMRALRSRGRLEQVGDGYRLLDPRPVEVGERGTIPPVGKPARATRARVARAEAEESPTDPATGLSYAAIGREVVDRLIDLGKEVATLRAEVRGAKDEVREARAARLEAEQRSEGFAARVRELEGRAEMAEINLRTLLASARGGGRDGGPVATTEMEAILGVLKGGASDAASEHAS
ncbi:MAG: hypothetical protein ACKOKE_04235 [Actinomycetota bacterium]